MIESRLDPLTDGIGGGPDDGDLTVAEIAVTFRLLAAEGRARSVSATLRILREQSKGRSQYAEYPLLPLSLSMLCGFALFVALLHPYHEGWLSSLALCLAFLGPLWAYAIFTRRQRARRVAQLGELRRLTLETLEAIVGTRGFVPRNLSIEERGIFGRLRSSDPESWRRISTILLGRET